MLTGHAVSNQFLVNEAYHAHSKHSDGLTGYHLELSFNLKSPTTFSDQPV